MFVSSCKSAPLFNFLVLFFLLSPLAVLSYQAWDHTMVRSARHALAPANPVQWNIDADGCPDKNSTDPGDDCQNQWDGRVYRRGEGGFGPRVAMLQAVKEQAHAACLIQLQDGRLAMAWFSGVEGTADVVIVFSRLDRILGQWEQPRVVSQHEGWSNQNPVLFEDPLTGNLHLIHTSQEAEKGQGTSLIFWLNSTDRGDTWSQPIRHLSFKRQVGAFVKGKIVTVKTLHGDKGDLDWLLPMYYTPAGTDRGQLGSHFSALWRSSDRGHTWGNMVHMSQPGQFLAQPTMVPTPQGNLLAFYRDRHGRWIYSSESMDEGQSWPRKQTKSKLPNNNSGIQALVLFNRHLVIAFNNQACEQVNNRTRCERYPLSLALSEDMGVTWGWVRDLEMGGENDPVEPKHFTSPSVGSGPHIPRFNRYSYPTLLQTRDCLIHVAFTYRKKTIKYVVVDENWIRRGNTTGEYRVDSYVPRLETHSTVHAVV